MKPKREKVMIAFPSSMWRIRKRNGKHYDRLLNAGQTILVEVGATLMKL